eukprot:Rmarinus@m.16513
MQRRTDHLRSFWLSVPLMIWAWAKKSTMMICEGKLLFFDATRDAVTEALSKCDNLGIKHRRPKDFYAEMVKSDEHMQRVKQRILSQKKRIEEAEERRRKRDMRKFGKQTQIEKQQERSKGKKEELNLIKKLRKGGAGEHTTGEIDAMLEGKRGAPGRGRKDAGEKRTNKKRELKNKKYGFGGRKRPMKTNDAKSASDMSSFSIRKNKQLPPGVSPKSGPNKSIQKRPGKMKRHQQRVKR